MTTRNGGSSIWRSRTRSMDSPKRIWLHIHEDDDVCPYFFEEDELGQVDTWEPNVEYVRSDLIPWEEIEEEMNRSKTWTWKGTHELLRDILEARNSEANGG